MMEASNKSWERLKMGSTTTVAPQVWRRGYHPFGLHRRARRTGAGASSTRQHATVPGPLSNAFAVSG